MEDFAKCMIIDNSLTISHSDIEWLEKLFPTHMRYVQNMNESGIMHHAYCITSPVSHGGAQQAFSQYIASLILQQDVQNTHRPLHDLWLARPDAETNAMITVDTAHALSAHVRSVPQVAPARVAILNAAHMMNAQAANALLKTIEEPQDASVIVLTTSQPERLPKTVRSRVHSIDLPPLSQELVNQHVASPLHRDWVAGRFDRFVQLQSAAPDEQEKNINEWKEEIKIAIQFVAAGTAERESLLPEKSERHSIGRFVSALEMIFRDSLSRQVQATIPLMLSSFQDQMEAIDRTYSERALHQRLQLCHTLARMVSHNVNARMIRDYLIIAL